MSRFRSRILTDTTSVFEWRRISDNALLSSDSHEYKYGYQSLTDNPTPGFFKKIARGDIIIGDMLKTEISRETSLGRLEYHNIANNDHQTGYGPGIRRYDIDRSINAARSSINVTSLEQKAADLAVIQAHANIAKPDVLGLVSAAELGKTIDLIRHPAKGLTDWLGRLMNKGLSYRRKHSAFDTADMIQNTWLEWRYGWRPLIYDIQGFCKALDHKLTDNGRVRSRGHNRQQQTATGTFNDGFNYHAVCDWYNNTWVDSWAGCIYDYNLPQSIKYAQLLGLTDLPGTAWELVPYSFVVDWFVGVGSWLSAITPTLGVSNVHCWVTSSCHQEMYSLLKGITTSSSNEYYVIVGQHRRQVMESYIRRSNGSVPLLPPVNVRLDPSKVLDLIFLARGYGQRIDQLRL